MSDLQFVHNRLVHHRKRDLVEFGDYIGCYFMDDRAAVTALLGVAGQLSGKNGSLAGDVYLVFTANEEVGGVWGSYASRCLPGELTIALEVGPTESSTTRPVRADRSSATAMRSACTTSPTPMR